MKKIFYLLCVATLTLVACVKDITPVVEDEEPEAVTLTFCSERPQLELTTRTAWDVETRSIVWTDGDKIRVGYTLNSAWMAKEAPATFAANDPAKFYASAEVSIDEDNHSIGTFCVPAGNDNFTNPGTSGSYQFFAFFPSSLSGASVSDPSALTVTLPTTQTPGDNTFDPKTDIMVGQSVAQTLSGLPTDPITLKWTRLVGHLDLKFSNLAFVGTETVSKVTLTFNDEAKVAGSFDVNIPEKTAGAGSENMLVLEGSGIKAYVIDGPDSVKVWASVLPVTFTSVDVEVKTDKAIYTRSITGINKTIKRNARNTLTINMATAQRDELEPDIFRLYTGTLTEGDYIVYYNGGAMKAATTAQGRLSYDEVTPENDIISTNDVSIVWHIAPNNGYWTLFNGDANKYAAATNSDGKAALLESATDDHSLWSVTGSDTFEFENKARAEAEADSRYLRRNGDYGFACYKINTGGTGPLTLYKKDLRTRIPAPASVTATINGSDDHVIDVTFSMVDGAASYVIVATPTGDGDVVTKTNVSGSPATISISDGLAYNTTYTISVYAVPSDTSAHIESHATPAPNTVTTGSAPLGYELIHSVSEVTSGRYILAAKVGNDYYGMLNSLPNPGTASSSPVTVTGNLVTTSDATAFVLTFTNNGNNYTIEGSNGTLCYSGNSTSFSTSETGNKALWTIEEGSRGSFRIKNVATTTRAIAFQTGTVYKFGAYAISNITATSNYYDVELFKYTGVVKTDPTFTVTPVSISVGQEQQLTVGTTSDGAKSYSSSDENVVTVSETGLLTGVATGTATITVTTAETNAYYAGSTTIPVTVTAGVSTIAQVLADGPGAYELDNLLVYLVNGNNVIVGDETGKMLLYKSNHNCAVGDNIKIASATVAAYLTNILQITGGTITKNSTGNTVNHGTPLDLTVQANAQSLTNEAGWYSAQYVSLTGSQDNRVVTGEYASVYITPANASTDGKNVIVTGYIYSFDGTNHSIQTHTIGLDPDFATLDVTTSATMNWAATEYGSGYAKTITVTQNANASGYTVNGTNSDWYVNDNGTGTITVYPVAANTDTNNPKTLTLTITHDDNTDLHEAVTCTQAKVTSTSQTYTLTNAMIVAAGAAQDSYKLWEISDSNENNWYAYAIKKSHSNATSSYHYLQIKKYASNTAYYIQVPVFGTKITSITMTVSSSSQPMTGGGNTATLFFSGSNSTSATGSGVASGTGASSVTINTSALNLNTGYITASGGVRIWEISITYE